VKSDSLGNLGNLPKATKILKITKMITIQGRVEGEEDADVASV